MRERILGKGISLPAFLRRPVPESQLQSKIRALLLAGLVWASWTGVSVLYTSPGNVAVRLGEPSPLNIKSPRLVTYISDVKTQEARMLAARAVDDVYVGPDRIVLRQQLFELDEATQAMSAVRADEALDRDEMVSRLRKVKDLALESWAGADIFVRILDLREDEWKSVVSEAERVLGTVMRDEIRPSGLAEARRRAQRLTSPMLSDEQQDVVVALVQRMIVPNSVHDNEKTLARRQEARNAVAPVRLTIREGESVLREGALVTSLGLEQLEVLGFQRVGLDWSTVLSQILLNLGLVICLSLYVLRIDPLLLHRPRRELLFTLVLITIGVTTRLSIPGRTILPYIFPAATAAMVVALLLNAEAAVAVAMASAVLVGMSAGASLELAIYTLVGSLISALALWRLDQLGTFIRAAVYLAFTNVLIVLGFRLHSHVYDAVGLLQLMASGVVNALLSTSLAFVAFAFIGRAFGIATSLQLLELARPNHPLFHQLLVEAPGTYHHSIVVSNMAERAAQAIGADALLSRVGCYYHDIGKTPRPYFFAENQSDGENPHDKLDPRTSAEIIIAHTTDGLALAHKYGIPERVCAFIPEHHGTTMVTYFYRQANQESDEEVREEDFRYKGPRPQSRETAIVMLADGIEAWVRANRPPTEAEMERVIRQVINNRLVSGQLDECDLTLSDLDAIREAFISVLKGIFHPRIKYPERAARSARRNGSSTSSGNAVRARGMGQSDDTPR